MQDFSLPFPIFTREGDFVGFTDNHRRLTEEELMESPLGMYLHSLSLKGKLPDKLHQAMLMWSFDPDQNEHVQRYLEWVKTCEERKISKEMWEKKFARNEKILKGTMIALGAALFAMFVTELLK